MIGPTDHLLGFANSASMFFSVLTLFARNVRTQDLSYCISMRKPFKFNMGKAKGAIVVPFLAKVRTVSTEPSGAVADTPWGATSFVDLRSCFFGCKVEVCSR